MRLDPKARARDKLPCVFICNAGTKTEGNTTIVCTGEKFGHGRNYIDAVAVSASGPLLNVTDLPNSSGLRRPV